MDVIVVDQNAEDLLYAAVVSEEQKATFSQEKVGDVKFMQCRFFHIAVNDAAKTIKNCLETVQDIESATVYACADGDVFIQWSGGGYTVEEKMISLIEDQYGFEIKKYMSSGDFFELYDMVDARSRLKAECSKKKKKHTKQAKQLAKYFSDITLISTLKKTVQLTKMQRTFRSEPHILIVEDQIFSQKILKSILKAYTCHVADGSGEALLMYIEKCPDIVLLDIELPDLSGHNVAKLFNDIDADSFVVMVSGNHYERDVKLAKANGAKAFIAKPYDKKAILQIIDQFKKARKRK